MSHITQVPEVGDWVICIKNPYSWWPKCYGERLLIQKTGGELNPGVYLCGMPNHFGLLPLKAKEFYIVKP